MSRLSFHKMASANHLANAERFGGGLYWQKISAVENALSWRGRSDGSRCDWVR